MFSSLRRFLWSCSNTMIQNSAVQQCIGTTVDAIESHPWEKWTTYKHNFFWGQTSNTQEDERAFSEDIPSQFPSNFLVYFETQDCEWCTMEPWPMWKVHREASAVSMRMTAPMTPGPETENEKWEEEESKTQHTNIIRHLLKGQERAKCHCAFSHIKDFNSNWVWGSE